MLSFAIVIPNLNQSHFLATALESLRHQSVKFNLAIMDGGSRDDFTGVVKRYSEMVNYLQSAPDSGQASAIKEGKEKIPGDIVTWLNADDYYFPGALLTVQTLFENDPTLDIVYGDAIHVDSDGNFLSYFPPAQEFNAAELARNNFICQPTCFYRRSAYEKVGGVNPALEFTMDWDLWCRFAANGAKFAYLRQPLAAVRHYQGTKTLSGEPKRYKEIFRIEKKYGHRLVPASLLGAYYQQVNFNTKNSLIEKAFSILYDLARGTKHRIEKISKKKRPRDELLYGFKRWEPVAEGPAQIHTLCYGSHPWNQVHLKIEPFSKDYAVKINGQSCGVNYRKKGYLSVDIPTNVYPHIQMEVAQKKNKRWKLIEFSGDTNVPDYNQITA